MVDEQTNYSKLDNAKRHSSDSSSVQLVDKLRCIVDILFAPLWGAS